MFVVNKSDKCINATRGDIGVLEVSAAKSETEDYMFQVNDVVRFSVYEKKRYDRVVLSKDVIVEEESATVFINLDKTDTKIGEVIHKPVDYWYEVELNPDTNPQTLVGYDTEGPKIFRLFPEGDDSNV